MKNDILELHYSLYIKKTLQKIHITKVSDLKEYDCLTLAKALPQDCNKALIIKKLNDLGYLPSAENAISIYDIPMSRKMRNIFLRNGIVYLAQLSAYPREEILQFRNVGEYAMSEIDTLCEKYGIQIRSLCPIKEAFSEFQFHKKIYPLFFRGNIFSVDDIRNKSAHDLYNICEQDYCLTMKTYHALMLMYGKEARNRKQEIDRQHHTIPNQRNQIPKDKHYGNADYYGIPLIPT